MQLVGHAIARNLYARHAARAKAAS
jgi:hypothetical protein